MRRQSVRLRVRAHATDITCGARLVAPVPTAVAADLELLPRLWQEALAWVVEAQHAPENGMAERRRTDIDARARHGRGGPAAGPVGPEPEVLVSVGDALDDATVRTRLPLPPPPTIPSAEEEVFGADEAVASAHGGAGAPAHRGPIPSREEGGGGGGGGRFRRRATAQRGEGRVERESPR